MRELYPLGTIDRIQVGDVGGTHARFAVVEPSEAGPWRILQRLDLAERFATFNDALRSYLERARVTPLPRLAAIAVAGPVVAGAARSTNRGWEISERALREVGFERALLINDFAALALAVDLLDERHLHPIGPQSSAEPSPSSAPAPGSVCPASRATAIWRYSEPLHRRDTHGERGCGARE
jgi:glucokinase